MKNGKIAGVVALLGGILAAAGVYLPWAKVTISGIPGLGGTASSQTVSGSGSTDGYVVIGMALIAAAVGIVMLAGKSKKALAAIVIVAGLIVGGIGFWDIGRAKNLATDDLKSEINSSIVASAGETLTPDQQQQVDAIVQQLLDALKISIGIGLYSVVVAGVLMIIGGGMGMAAKAAAPPMPAMPGMPMADLAGSAPLAPPMPEMPSTPPMPPTPEMPPMPPMPPTPPDAGGAPPA